eukprot:scaffold28019_cov132-Isochrysis_galbana.AAC.4
MQTAESTSLGTPHAARADETEVAGKCLPSWTAAQSWTGRLEDHTLHKVPIHRRDKTTTDTAHTTTNNKNGRGQRTPHEEAPARGEKPRRDALSAPFPPRTAFVAAIAPITAAGRTWHACCLREMAPFLIALASNTTAALC